MPTLRENRKRRLSRAKATQRSALRLQRIRMKRFARLRAEIRRARSKIGKRRKYIQGLERILAEGPVTIEGNGGPGKVHGGTPEQRVVACAVKAALMHAMGIRKSFYRQAGAWTVQHGILGEPKGYRSDCSQFWLSMYWSAGLPDPTGYGYRGGYTGTIGKAGRQVSAPGQPAGAGLYSSGTFHHVELCLGGGRFIGHGSPPVDYLTPGLPNHYRDYL